jgi:hypothetical protein
VSSLPPFIQVFALEMAWMRDVRGLRCVSYRVNALGVSLTVRFYFAGRWESGAGRCEGDAGRCEGDAGRCESDTGRCEGMRVGASRIRVGASRVKGCKKCAIRELTSMEILRRFPAAESNCENFRGRALCSAMRNARSQTVRGFDRVAARRSSACPGFHTDAA